MYKTLISLSLTLVLALPAMTLPAFPGAEGAGANALGGRGGAVLFVTNLEDYQPGKETPIPGSLRAAVDTKGPRTILFRVAGTIPLKATLSVSNPFVTIAGQSAPGGGICLKNHGMNVNTHDVIIRHLRIRPGDEVGRALAKEGKDWSTDALSINTPSRDVIIDHCSMSWAKEVSACRCSGDETTELIFVACIITFETPS